ncbi:MAG: hypothetical protein AB8G96_02050, partial [Phycisphaerales bacterium]
MSPAVPVRAFVLASLCSATAAAQTPVVGPQQRIDAGGTAAAHETTGSASPVNPMEIIAGWNDWRFSPTIANEVISTGFSLSIDGGATWSDFVLRPPVANQSGVEGDPMTAWDPRTGDLYAGGISFSAGANSGLYVARKTPGAATFQPSVMARVASGTDKPWMVVGQRPNFTNTSRVYIAYNEGVVFSDDFGATWTNPTPTVSGIGFLPRIGPNGSLYIAYWDFNDGVRVLRSFDGGQTFDDQLAAVRMDVWGTQSASRTPGTFRVPPINVMAIGPNGAINVVYMDTTQVIGGESDVDLYLVRSIDQGLTWSTPTIIADDPAGAPLGDQIFPWIEADANGGLHVVFLDTVNDVRPDGGTAGIYDAYYAFSADDGATWSRERLSPTSFNTDNDGLARFNQFFGDYLGMANAGNKMYPIYPDSASGDPDIFTNEISLAVAGDVNGDGVVSFADIVLLL